MATDTSLDGVLHLEGRYLLLGGQDPYVAGSRTQMTQIALQQGGKLDSGIVPVTDAISGFDEQWKVSTDGPSHGRSSNTFGNVSDHHGFQYGVAWSYGAQNHNSFMPSEPISPGNSIKVPPLTADTYTEHDAVSNCYSENGGLAMSATTSDVLSRGFPSPRLTRTRPRNRSSSTCQYTEYDGECSERYSCREGVVSPRLIMKPTANNLSLPEIQVNLDEEYEGFKSINRQKQHSSSKRYHSRDPYPPISPSSSYGGFGAIRDRYGITRMNTVSSGHGHNHPSGMMREGYTYGSHMDVDIPGLALSAYTCNSEYDDAASSLHYNQDGDQDSIISIGDEDLSQAPPLRPPSSRTNSQPQSRPVRGSSRDARSNHSNSNSTTTTHHHPSHKRRHYRRTTQRANGGTPRKASMPKCHTHPDKTFRNPSEYKKHLQTQHTRPFFCAFDFAGCTLKFGSKNEWKRHVESQHVKSRGWVCDDVACRERKAVFDRKDLFGQHLRRMHKPPGSSSSGEGRERGAPAADWPKDDFQKVQERCLRERRAPPTSSLCIFCSRRFEGLESWEKRMEHVGKHYEDFASKGVEGGGGRRGQGRVLEGMVMEKKAMKMDEGLIKWALEMKLIEPVGEGDEEDEDEEEEGKEGGEEAVRLFYRLVLSPPDPLKEGLDEDYTVEEQDASQTQGIQTSQASITAAITIKATAASIASTASTAIPIHPISSNNSSNNRTTTYPERRPRRSNPPPGPNPHQYLQTHLHPQHYLFDQFIDPELLRDGAGTDRIVYAPQGQQQRSLERLRLAARPGNIHLDNYNDADAEKEQEEEEDEGEEDGEVGQGEDGEVPISGQILDVVSEDWMSTCGGGRDLF